MARTPVYTKVKDILQARILAGEYVVHDLPGERKIAAETGVSYMTARKAVAELIAEKILARRPNGTLIVHPAHRDAHAVASAVLLVPAYPSSHLARCRIEIARVATDHRVRLRTIEYTYWYDSIITEAMQGADGLFIIPSTEELPDHLLDAFVDGSNRVVFFDADMSDRGIPSIRLFAELHFRALFDHVKETGRERIDCLNTQGHNDEILQRLASWRVWAETNGVEGKAWDHPVEPFEDPIEAAHAVVHGIVTGSDPKPDALVCTTYPAAVGAVRALRDQGIEAGVDIAVCSMNIEFPGRFASPSITGLEFPDIEPLLVDVFEWFKADNASSNGSGDTSNWSGQHLIVPKEPALFIGETTRPRG
ncbi:MAG: GntR family transcriptional regulator [Planctomycetota bacterium]